MQQFIIENQDSYPLGGIKPFSEGPNQPKSKFGREPSGKNQAGAKYYSTKRREINKNNPKRVTTTEVVIEETEQLEK